jgi:hypothetical protein
MSRELLQEARSRLSYDPETGIFRWLVSKKGISAGSIAGSASRKGYLVITLNQKHHYSHRLAWLFMKEEWTNWPEEEIDHINGIRTDNRFANLRKVSRQQNAMNCRAKKTSPHGIKGVAWDSTRRKWMATIMIGGKNKTLGRFDSAEEAHRVYCTAANQLFGEFACHE